MQKKKSNKAKLNINERSPPRGADWPRASLSLSADIQLNVLNTSYDRMCLCDNSVEVGT